MPAVTLNPHHGCMAPCACGQGCAPPPRQPRVGHAVQGAGLSCCSRALPGTGTVGRTQSGPTLAPAPVLGVSSVPLHPWAGAREARGWSAGRDIVLPGLGGSVPGGLCWALPAAVWCTLSHLTHPLAAAAGARQGHPACRAALPAPVPHAMSHGIWLEVPHCCTGLSAVPGAGTR